MTALRVQTGGKHQTSQACLSGVSKYLVFYAQSTIMVISGRYTFCRYTIIVKKYVHVKNFTCIQIFFKSLEVGKTQTENLFSNIIYALSSQSRKPIISLRKRKTEIHVSTSDLNFQTVSPFNIIPV